MKTSKAQHRSAEQAEGLRRTGHLRDAVVQRAQERGDSPADVARTLDMSVGHWYRLKKEPERLGCLPLARLQNLASYVGWPTSQVMVAVGWLRAEDLAETLSGEKAVMDALNRLQAGALANGLVTPVAKAALDHQVLLAHLFLLAEAGATGLSPPK